MIGGKLLIVVATLACICFAEQNKYCSVETSLKVGTITAEAQQQILVETANVLEVSASEISIYDMSYNPDCTCQTITFEMSPELVQIFEQMVMNQLVSIEVFGTTVQYISITMVTVSADGQITEVDEFSRVETTISTEKISDEIMRALVIQTADFLNTKPREIKIAENSFDPSCACQQITFGMSSSLAQVFQEMINNRMFNLNVGNQEVQYMTAITVTLTDDGNFVEQTQSCQVETSMKLQEDVTQEMQQQILVETAKMLEVDVSEININQIYYNPDCGCQTVVFQMSASLMQLFQQLIAGQSFIINVGGELVQFLDFTWVVVTQSGTVSVINTTPSGAAAQYMCFSGDSMLITPSGPLKMKDVTYDDKIAVLRGPEMLRFEPIRSFFHRVDDKEATFVQIQTALNNTLELSGSHLIPLVPCDLTFGEIEAADVFAKYSVFASRAAPGYCVLSFAGNKWVTDAVQDVRTVRKVGYYSPITPAGNVVVGNVAASCYSQIENHAMQQILFDGMHYFKKTVTGATKLFNKDGRVYGLLKMMHQAGSLLIGS